MFRKYTLIVTGMLCIGMLSGCASRIPEDALKFTPESLQDRQLQTRRFDTQDEGMLLSACAALLQDLGFTINESETNLGMIIASKDRSAVTAGQVTAQIVLALLGAYYAKDRNQKMRASVVTRPVGQEGKNTAVRVTFQRIVWNEQGQVTKRERLNDPEIYQEFFEKLSKSVFLEAHQL